LGNVDSLVVEHDIYEIEGDWGRVRVGSDPPQIHDR
jgi:hypothetical protein